MLGYSIIKIEGYSMEPALKAGSFALVKKVKDYRIGDIVLFRIQSHPPMVKRISQIENENYFLAGDNSSDSLDSRTLGWVPKCNILGKIIWK